MGPGSNGCQAWSLPSHRTYERKHNAQSDLRLRPQRRPLPDGSRFLQPARRPTKAGAISAGTEPGLRVHPEVLEVMKEVGIDLSNAKPQKLTQELAEDAALLVTMGCGDKCPYVPGLRRDDWPLQDPKGLPIDDVSRYGTTSRTEYRPCLGMRGLHACRNILKSAPPHQPCVALHHDSLRLERRRFPDFPQPGVVNLSAVRI